MRSGSTSVTIAFACLGDAHDQEFAGGVPHAMRCAFVDLGCTVIDAFPLVAQPGVAGLRTWLHRLNGEHHHADRTDRALAGFAKEIARRTAGTRPDFLFSPDSVPITRLRTTVPIIVSQYQTFMESIAHLPYEQEPPSIEYVRQALAQEREAFGNSAACVFPSTRSLICVRQMQSDSGRLEMIPWGSSLRAEPDAAAVRRHSRQRIGAPLRLLFAGERWAAAGGGIMLETCRELHRRGIEFHLDIIGVTPPIEPPPWATVIARNDAGQMPDLPAGPAGYHFLLAPLRIDARPHLLSEAAAYGVPAITTDIGGLSSIVIDGETGRCLPLSAGPADWADALIRLACDHKAYLAMAENARARVETTLNWRSFARRVVEVGYGTGAGESRSALPMPVAAPASRLHA